MSKIIGHGTTISGSAAGPIGDLVDIPRGFGASVEVDDATTFESENLWKEKLFSLKDAGQLTFSIEYDGSSGGEADVIHTNLGVSQTWTVSVKGSGHGVWACEGAIIEYSTPIPLGTRVTQDVTIEFSGEPSMTPA